jgi:hypothetical protein
VWKVNSEDLERANLNYRICAIGFVVVAGQKPILNALYNDAAGDGCKMGDEAKLYGTSRNAIQVSDWVHCVQISVASAPERRLVASQLDHKGLDMISEYRTGSSVGSIPNGVIDGIGVGPIVALLDVIWSSYSGNSFVSVRFSWLIIPGAITEVNSTGEQRMELIFSGVRRSTSA